MKVSRELYGIWYNMLHRCENPRNKGYRRYGGRGITVCERWRTYENFALDMLPRPPGYSLDRVNNNGNYCFENCRWANPKQQSRNTCSNFNLVCGGETKTLAEWVEVTGLTRSIVENRIKAGWSHEEALSTPQKIFRSCFEIAGESYSTHALEKSLQVSKGAIRRRLRRGVSVEIAAADAIRHKGRNTKLHTYNGETLTLKQLSAKYDVNYDLLQKRLLKGLTLKQALETALLKPKVLTYNGQIKTVSEWAETLGWERDTLKARLLKGWSVERALTEPLRSWASGPARKTNKLFKEEA